MKVDFYKPKNSILKEHIAGYYFVSEDSSSKPVSYLTFPNNYCILSIYQNAEEAFSKNRYVIRPSKENKIVSSLFSKYSKPIEIIYEKLVNEITIYFNPIKINHFIHSLKIFEEAQISDFTPYPDLEQKMELIFSDTCRDRQSKLLEDYLISKFIQKDLTVIERILSDIDAGLRLEYIAEKFNFTRQHINKIFSKNVGKTPSEYRKVQRFRNALIKQKISANLTDLSNDNLYFDQSHFIKNFREFTNEKPSDFFKKVDVDKENIWLYL